MARKESVTRDYLFETAFQMLKEEGLDHITARKLAARAGCSTQPIFRLYTSMEELWKELFQRGMEYFEEFYNRTPRYDNTPFVNLGVTYIRFAMEEPRLFQMLFLSENRYGKSLYEILNGKMGAVGREIAKAKAEGCDFAGQLFMKMWIFIHGAACMSITGDYDLDMKDTIEILKNAYIGFSKGKKESE
ncbi:MAG: TetR/AcrR family transcriptional regulator [Lachnospiraceae bacterium]